MSPEHFDRFFAFVAIGLGLLLAGGLNLAFGRGGRRVWLRGVATLVVCGLVAAGLAAFTRPELAVRAAGVMLGVVALVFVLGSEWFARQLTALVAVLHRPAARWGLLTLTGLMVVLGGVVAFEVADRVALDQQMQELDYVLLGKPETQPTQRALAKTDRGTAIVLKEAAAPREPSELVEPEEKTLRNGHFHGSLIRQSGPNTNSNCHGWVFTGGKFFVTNEDVEAIVKENGYQEVQVPQPGDLVVYRQGGSVAHTAIVRYVAEGQPVLVEGKWGVLGVYLHPADKSCYGTQYTFHRSARSGHLLVGLGGTAGPSDGMNHTAE